MNYKKLNVLIVLLIILVSILIFVYTYPVVSPIIRLLWNAISVFLLAFIFAWLLNPLKMFFIRKKTPVIIASVLSVLIPILIISGIIILIVPVFTSQAKVMWIELKDVYKNIIENNSIEKIIEQYNIPDFNISIEKLQDMYEKFTEGGGMIAINKVYTGAASVISVIVHIVVAPVFAVYILADYNNITKNIYGFLSIFKWRDNIINMIKDIEVEVRKFVKGVLGDSTAMAILAFIFFSIAKLPFAIVFAVIIGLFNIIPFFGAFISGLLPVAFAFAISKSLKYTILILAIVLSLQIIEAWLLRPLIIGKTVQQSPMLLLSSMAVFGALFGFLGIILATPIVSTIKILLRYIKKYIDERKINKNES